MMTPQLDRFFSVAVVCAVAIGSAAPLQAQQTESEGNREQKACGPADVKHGVRIVAVWGAGTEPTPDTALVYVVRPESFGGAIQTKLAVDGKWVGVNLGNTYFAVMLNAGEHHLCSHAGNRSLMTLTVEAGKTYYLEQRPVTNLFGKMKNSLKLLSEKEGQRAIKSCQPSMMFEKRP